MDAGAAGAVLDADAWDVSAVVPHRWPRWFITGTTMYTTKVYGNYM